MRVLWWILVGMKEGVSRSEGGWAGGEACLDGTGSGLAVDVDFGQRLPIIHNPAVFTCAHRKAQSRIPRTNRHGILCLRVL